MISVRSQSKSALVALVLTLGAVGVSCNDTGTAETPSEEQTDPEGGGDNAPGGDAELPTGSPDPSS
ncbi:MAG: hypothetical protein M3198_08945 [Actinomycetota bacterium]|nr:hypothetical protein [Actinomycetota bacterium]